LIISQCLSIFAISKSIYDFFLLHSTLKLYDNIQYVFNLICEVNLTICDFFWVLLSEIFFDHLSSLHLAPSWQTFDHESVIWDDVFLLVVLVDALYVLVSDVGPSHIVDNDIDGIEKYCRVTHFIILHIVANGDTWWFICCIWVIPLWNLNKEIDKQWL
jgi:hypothetical protein